MKMDKRYRPELIASKDETRSMLLEPWLDVVNKVVVASNGHMLVAVPVETGEGDTTGVMPSEALKAGRKAAKGLAEVEIAANGAATTTSGASFVRKDMNFVPWQAVVPSYRKGDKDTITIFFDANYLKQLVDALGCDGLVSLTFPKSNDDDPIVIRSESKSAREGEIAVLMPIRKSK